MCTSLRAETTQPEQASHSLATVWMTAPRTIARCLATTCLLTCNTQQILSSPHCVARNMEAKSWDACHQDKAEPQGQPSCSQKRPGPLYNYRLLGRLMKSPH